MIAWVWSAVATTTASKSLPISSYILRQSLYFLALGKRSNTPLPPVYFQSTSHNATMFSDSRFLRLAKPIPPTPTPAMFNLSLGALCPKPATTWLGMIEKAAAAAAVVPRKDLLDTILLSEFFSIIIKVSIG